MPIVKKTFYIFIAILLALMVWLTICHPDWIVAGPPKAGALGLSDKQDAACTGHETAGRCADKCPDGDFVRGYDDNGAAICGHVTGCPYGDSIPLGPECDKHAPAVYNEPQATTPAPAETFAGK